MTEWLACVKPVLHKEYNLRDMSKLLHKGQKSSNTCKHITGTTVLKINWDVLTQ